MCFSMGRHSTAQHDEKESMEVAESSRTNFKKHDKCEEIQESCTMTVLRIFGGNCEEGLLRRSLEVLSDIAE